jgi:cardiolipin synthase
MTPNQLPNAITVARMVMALPLLWLLMNAAWRPALAVAVVAGLSDGLDGLLAKRYGWQSELGGLLDPLADKLLMSVCFFGLWWSDLLPTWLVALVLGRDVVIVAGAFAWARIEGAFHAEPSGLSKATTLAQLVLIAMVLAQPAGLPLWPDWIPPVALATAAITLLSGVDYVVRFGRRAWRRRGGGR